MQRGYRVKGADIILLLPGLSEQLRRLPVGHRVNRQWHRFLRYAKMQTHPYNMEEIKFKVLCGVVPSDLPIAAVTASMDGLDPTKIWMRADPMHCSVDLAHVYHLKQQPLIFTEHEIQSLLACLQPIFAESELYLYAPCDTRWYLQCPNTPEIITFAPEAFLGKSLMDYFPQGRARMLWLRLFTEIQMVLQNCEVNKKRRALMQPTIDALWFWGNGAFCVQNKENRFSGVLAEDDVTLGLANLQGYSNIQKISWDLSALSDYFYERDYLLSFENPFMKMKHLDDIFDQIELFFSILLRAIRQKKISSLMLYPGDKHCYHVSVNVFAWSRPWQVTRRLYKQL